MDVSVVDIARDFVFATFWITSTKTVIQTKIDFKMKYATIVSPHT